MSSVTVERVLTEGEMEVHGRIAGSSNATLLVTCRLADEELLAVYKPSKGERPLWDFPGGLFRREVAAYLRRFPQAEYRVRVIPNTSFTKEKCSFPHWAMAYWLRAPQAMAHTARASTLAI